MPKGKAQADAKAQHTWAYVSILRRFATPPLGIRCIFEIGSNQGTTTTSRSSQPLSKPPLRGWSTSGSEL